MQRLRCVWFRLGATQSNGPPIDKARRCWPIHKHERPWTCDATDDIASSLEEKRGEQYVLYTCSIVLLAPCVFAWPTPVVPQEAGQRLPGFHSL